MLRIYSNSWRDLVESPPEQVIVDVQGESEMSTVTLSCRLIQDQEFVYGRLYGTVYWDDGTLPETFEGNGTISLDLAHLYTNGHYNARVEVSDNVLPSPERLSTNFPFHVKVGGQTKPRKIIYGPILPKDAGFPNPTQWNFDIGADVEILASSVKMLLLTAKGERIHNLDYGTNLRAVLFEFEAAGIEVLLRQEVTEALARWEPRVDLQFLAVEKTAPREYRIIAGFISKLNQTPFTLSLDYK